jgi:hypothetical protein
MVTMDAFGVSKEQPKRDKRLTLELLDEIARATEGGQPTTTSEMETRQGWTREQVWRELMLLSGENLIRAEDIKTPNDERGKTNLRIDRLTEKGWRRYDELRWPIRAWLARDWKWLITTVIAVAALAVAILALLRTIALEAA